MVPIFFGVTGHRDLATSDKPRLRSQLRALFRDYQSRFPASRFYLLTLLAPGADTFAARVAAACGVGVIAVSPMPLCEYEKDFIEKRDLLRFRALWCKAEKRIELPLVAENETRVKAGKEIERNLQYAAGGAFIAAQSQILVAMWDGTDNGNIGGTSYVVKTKLSGDVTALRPESKKSALSIPNTGPVFHLPVLRKNAQAGAPLVTSLTGEAVSRIAVLYPDGWEAKAKEAGAGHGGEAGDLLAAAQGYFEGILSRIDECNKDCCNRALVNHDLIQASGSDLYASEDLTPGQKKLWALYRAADTLAVRFQRKTTSALRAIVLFSVSAFVAFSLFDQFYPSNWLYAIFWVLFACAFGCLRTANDASWEFKFYEYRALAEGVRVQLAWRLAGIAESVTDHYLEKYTENMPWLLTAISNCSLDANAESGNTAKLALVIDRWVEGQHEYFAKALKKKNRHLGHKKVSGEVLTGTAIVLMLIACGGSIACSGVLDFKNRVYLFNSPTLKLYVVLTFLATTLIALAGAFAFYADKRAFQDEAFLYRRMKELFARARSALAVCEGDVEKQDILRDLGQEALSENGDWLLSQRSKPLEMRW